MDYTLDSLSYTWHLSVALGFEDYDYDGQTEKLLYELFLVLTVLNRVFLS